MIFILAILLALLTIPALLIYTGHWLAGTIITALILLGLRVGRSS